MKNNLINPIKLNIKMRVTPKQSEKIQKICFKQNMLFAAKQEVILTNKPFIFLTVPTSELILNFAPRELLGYISILEENQEIYFNEHEHEEIDADFFIETNGICKKE